MALDAWHYRTQQAASYFTEHLLSDWLSHPMMVHDGNVLAMVVYGKSYSEGEGVGMLTQLL